MSRIKEVVLDYYMSLRDNEYCVVTLSPSLFKSLLNRTAHEYSQYPTETVCVNSVLYSMKGNNSHLAESRRYVLYRKGLCMVIFEDTDLTGRSYRKLENKPKKLPPLNYC